MSNYWIPNFRTVLGRRFGLYNELKVLFKKGRFKMEGKEGTKEEWRRKGGREEWKKRGMSA